MSSPTTIPAPLSRTLNKLDVTLVGVGASIGAGIFVVSGEAAKLAGPAVVLSFFVAAFVCVLNALCYAEMASRVPVSGSAYVYSRVIFGEFAAAVTGLNLLFDYHIGAALIARNLVQYIRELLIAFGIQGIPSWLDKIDVPGAPFLSFSITAPLVLLILSLILLRGVRESATVNNIMTSLKIFIVLFVIIAGCTVLDPGNWTPLAPEGVPSIFRASSLVFFAYIGFDAVCNTAEECIQPEQTLPFGIIASLTVCAVLYAGVTLVLTGLTPFQQLSSDASLSAAFNGHHMDWMKIVIDIGAVIGLTTTLFLGLYSQSRMYLAIARDGLLPSSIAKVTEEGVPRNATWMCAVVAGSLALLLDVERLSSLLDMGILLAYSVVCACVLVVRARGSDESGEGSVGSVGSVGGVGSVGSVGSVDSWTREQKKRQSNVERCYVAVFFLFATFLVPGFAINNNWTIGGTPLLVSYVVVGLGLNVWLVARVDFSGGSSSSSSPHRTPKKSLFLSPWVPLIPSSGLAFNGYLMTQRPWEGWVRLFSITLVVLLVYYWSKRKQRKTTMERSWNEAGGSDKPLLSSSLLVDSGEQKECGSSLNYVEAGEGGNTVR